MWSGAEVRLVKCETVLPGRANAAALEREITWFSQVLERRIALYFEQSGAEASIESVKPPDLSQDPSEYAQVVAENGFGFAERIVLILALLPHVRPQVLDTLFVRNKNLERGYTEFGGWRGKSHGGFLPTCETAAFILAGNQLERRFELMPLFEPEHTFYTAGILRIDPPGGEESFFSGALLVTSEYLHRCTSGVSHKPDYSTRFPAKRITTPLAWSDLVLAPQVLADIGDIITWINHAKVIMSDWGLGRAIKPGYRSLFYGPPGTGKTLTATLIGDTVGADVYRIDLSMVVSKYIGETEKNLANVFDQAQSKHWILFFDEADALFGKRTQTSSANDRYANQEVSYLLQRVEDFPGVVILATNLKGNIDEAFARRFQSLIHFPMPDAEQRLRLWESMLNGHRGLANGIDLAALAEKYELAGGAITNVVRYGAISALQQQRDTLCLEDLVNGVAKELRKEGKTL